MLSREISSSSNLMSYRERKATQIPGNVKRFVETCKGNLALVFAIIWNQCVLVFSVRLFNILLLLCNAIFSFSFKHSEHLLLVVLYAWCRTNDQGYKYVCFLQYHTMGVIHFMNGEGVCYSIRRSIFNV